MGLSAIEDYAIGGSILFIACIGFILNLLLLFKMKKRVEENPEERMNKLYISLAITHLLLLGILMPFSSSSSLFRTWLWGDLGCTYYGFMGMLLGMNMIMTMMLICFDLLFEANASGYDWEIRDKVLGYMVVFIWLQAIFWGVVPLFGWSSYDKEPTGLSCTTVIKQSEINGYVSFILSTTVFLFAVPLMGMFMCWIIIQTRGKQMSEGQMELAKFNKRKIALLMILLVIEWGPYTAYYCWPIFFGYEPLRLNAVAAPLCKSSVILTTLVLLSIVSSDLSKNRDQNFAEE